ncbi:trehalose-phosphatase [Mycolicibacterium moriokaense]|uniref:Trehalose 6-phosphate phosphatase n=1 Tax=Mycolicibacterium moriokaense TaxID=39691 RepID=A0AAD1HAB6_9MYCO|nr:trehalose-phosphatase [Mycolicibacterium moriokaense]MCV7040218.1 trehalose-phosphatase [Mycolicibacterium moriokaense]ORB20065.1 trehalose-phosphatase [Mycolicibacterium moriokaense]BBX00233.1 trehalose 6-phosphate phosphatase [Mycolicibacterium moriokaense]
MLPIELQRALDSASRVPKILVTCDFDGTLAPIVSNPADARMLPEAAAALTALADLPDTEVALVSGRALDVLRTLSAVPPAIHLVGSHGAEFDTGFAHNVDEELLGRIIAELNEIAADKPGVTVETKPASVALHVRNASPADGEAALEAARRASAAWDAHVTAGKAVLEFAVISTDKGEAVDILRDQTGSGAVVFLGDDVTDEKAFVRLRDGDVGVKVGPGESAARYRVESPEDVAAALAYLLDRRRTAGS